MSSITDDVGVLLGRSPLPVTDQILADLLGGWTQSRIDAYAAFCFVTLDLLVRDRVITKAVARYMSRPRDGVTQESVQVDDGQMTRSYAKPSGELGEVEILDEWWTELGLPLPAAEAESFSIRPHYHRPYRHRSPWGRDSENDR